jgi:hypothetical protein
MVKIIPIGQVADGLEAENMRDGQSLLSAEIMLLASVVERLALKCTPITSCTGKITSLCAMICQTGLRFVIAAIGIYTLPR